MPFCPGCVSTDFRYYRKYNEQHGFDRKVLDDFLRRFDEAKIKDKSWCDLKVKLTEARNEYKKFKPKYKNAHKDLEKALEKLSEAQANLYKKSNDEQRSLIRERENCGCVDQRFGSSTVPDYTEAIFDQSEYEKAGVELEAAKIGVEVSEEAFKRASTKINALRQVFDEAENDIEEYEEIIKKKICVCTIVLSHEMPKT